MSGNQISPISTICVFCGSSEAARKPYYEAATQVGRLLGERGMTMVFGGGTIGMMGACARAAHESGGTVIGVIPAMLNLKGIAYEACDDLIVTESMRERKAIMDERSDAFLALPGGLGTLEEFIEHAVLKQLGFHQKPVILLNTKGFFDPLLRLFDHLIGEKFLKSENRSLYYVASTPEDAFGYLDAYEPVVPVEKWMR